MEIGESRVDEGDCKPSALPQHEISSCSGLDDSAETRLGTTFRELEVVLYYGRSEICFRSEHIHKRTYRGLTPSYAGDTSTLPQVVIMDGLERETTSILVSAALNTSPASGLLKRCGSTYGVKSDQSVLLKRVKIEDPLSESSKIETSVPPVLSLLDVSMSSSGTNTRKPELATMDRVEPHGTHYASIEKDNSIKIQEQSFEAVSQVSNTNTDSNQSLCPTSTPPMQKNNLQDTAQPSPPHPPPKPLPKVEDQQEVAPLKATHFRHLHQKYSSELEYMLREFQKLEGQLLGAKNTTGASVSVAAESTASRERREKLHSFILHLEDTFQQIVAGVALEDAGKPTSLSATKECDVVVDSQSRLVREKEDEENVQKLEEHILANLLPVKVRLKKQLSAQQGAKHNPAGMPVVRGGGMIQVADTTKKATFLKAEPPRVAFYHPPTTTNTTTARRMSLLGNPEGGSSLTQKLHGPTDDAKGKGPITAQSPAIGKPKILFAGMALGSEQIDSSITAATSIHPMEINCPSFLKVRSQAHLSILEDADNARLSTSDAIENSWPDSIDGDHMVLSDEEDDFDEPDHIYSKHGTQLSLAAHAAILSYEEKRKARKKRRKKKKLMLLQQQKQQQQAAHAAAVAAAAAPKRKKIIKKRGPRNVEYMCALCNEVYNSTCDYNPWWALTQQDCPKCGKLQVPRIDIGAPANAIEYHPALLAHADEMIGVCSHTPEAIVLPIPPPPQLKVRTSASDMDDLLHSDLSDDDGLLSDDDDSFDCSDSEDDMLPSSSLADQAEREKFGVEYNGPKLSNKNASRLLTLMLHATTCPCRHKNKEHSDVCRSIKYLMLHVRDCPGTTSSFDVCPFPWCRKVKHLLHHLVSCSNPKSCAFCSSTHLNGNMKRLRALNDHRGEKYKTALRIKLETTVAKSGFEAAPTKPNDSTGVQIELLEPKAEISTMCSLVKEEGSSVGVKQSISSSLAEPLNSTPASIAKIELENGSPPDLLALASIPGMSKLSVGNSLSLLQFGTIGHSTVDMSSFLSEAILTSEVLDQFGHEDSTHTLTIEAMNDGIAVNAITPTSDEDPTMDSTTTNLSNGAIKEGTESGTVTDKVMGENDAANVTSVKLESVGTR